MPGVTAEIERPARVRVGYRDLSGAEQIEEADGLRAVCHQHEIDQLDGIFWTQRLSALKRDQVDAALSEIAAARLIRNRRQCSVSATCLSLSGLRVA